MITLHEVLEPEKVQMLAENMRLQGWQGMPLVKLDDEQLITGVHRYTAAHRMLEWDDDDIPMIGIVDVFAEEGLNFESLYLENMKHHSYRWYPALKDTLVALSVETKEKYDIDID